jgi:hypothetical protein
MSDASSPLADGFDSVAVGIEDIGRVIVVMIALAEAGSAIVRSAIGKCCGMKRIDCCPVISGEGEMDREPLPALLVNPRLG